MAETQNFDDSMLSLALARVTEAAAIASAGQIGRGDEDAADQAAVDAMRRALNQMPIAGRVVIGEGERDAAPMLYIGEQVGTGDGPAVDIALDPLEGTTLTAKAMPNALCVIAMGPRGSMLHAPDVYMDKLAVGPGYAPGIVSLDMPPAERIAALAAAKGCEPAQITVCLLDRPRHARMIAEIRTTGAAIRLITDGDVAGVMDVTDPASTGVDLYMGSGGAPEGVLAAAALRCLGGQMSGRLLFRDDAERNRARAAGITDLDRVYTIVDMVRGDVIFAASGVTSGSLLPGVKTAAGMISVDTLLMRSRSGSRRRITYERQLP